MWRIRNEETEDKKGRRQQEKPVRSEFEVVDDGS
jgi:hypothetical protein